MRWRRMRPLVGRLIRSSFEPSTSLLFFRLSHTPTNPWFVSFPSRSRFFSYLVSYSPFPRLLLPCILLHPSTLWIPVIPVCPPTPREVRAVPRPAQNLVALVSRLAFVLPAVVSTRPSGRPPFVDRPSTPRSSPLATSSLCRERANPAFASVPSSLLAPSAHRDARLEDQED